MMRNKLKRSRNVQDAAEKGEDCPQATEVTVLSGSSCSGDEKCPGADEKERRTLCNKGFKIAPVFLRTNQNRKRRRSSDVEPDQSEQVPQEVVPPAQSLDVRRSNTTVKHGEAVSSCCGQLPSSALQSYLEQIQASNPAFPVQTIFSTLQKKASQWPQEPRSSDSLQKHLKEKKKSGKDPSEGSPKHLWSSLCAEAHAGHDVQDSSVLAVKTQRGVSKLSRTNRLKQQSDPVSATHLHKGPDTVQRDNVLWTDKFHPRCSSEVIGNSASVNKLHSWLKKWKLRADSDEGKKREEKKREENSSWDCGDFQGEAVMENGEREPLCNAMLLEGPSGVGKTASVYACAQELGFKVFEVNCSSRRSGRHVLSQLKEATQSHLVDVSVDDPLKPAFFNNYSSNRFTPESEALPGKTRLPKSIASKRKAARNSSSSGRRAKAKPATVTLAHYFRMKEKADHVQVSDVSQAERTGCREPDSASLRPDRTEAPSRPTATSLILFEEVDVIFEDDVGFLAAIKDFITTTKRPVVLTTNDPSFKERFSCSLEEILFKTPSAVNVCSYLQLVCLAEGTQLDSGDVSGLVGLTRGDVRRCLLQLQLWVLGSRGWTSQAGAEESTGSRYLNSAVGGGTDPQLPPCTAGCSAFMLGLHPVTPHFLLNFLKSWIWSETDLNRILKLLAESWSRGVPLLYSNLELLLSLGAAESSQSEPGRSDVQRPTQRIGPQVSVTCSRPVRSVSRLSRRKRTASTFPSLDWTDRPQSTSSSFSDVQSRAPSLSDQPEKHAAKMAANDLNSLADLFDLMSCIDATLPDAGPLGSESFVWTGAALKEGLLDEMREEDSECRSQERLWDIKAAAEGLGFHRCWWRISETWTEAQKHKPESEDKRWRRQKETPSSSLSFASQPLCTPSASHRSYKLSRMVLSSKSFALLGNRQAVCVDYMPVLRSFCHALYAQKQGELGRCWSHLSSTRLGLSQSAVQLLTKDSTLERVWKET